MRYILKTGAFRQDGDTFHAGDVVEISAEEAARNPKKWQPEVTWEPVATTEATIEGILYGPMDMGSDRKKTGKKHERGG